MKLGAEQTLRNSVSVLPGTSVFLRCCQVGKKSLKYLSWLVVSDCHRHKIVFSVYSIMCRQNQSTIKVKYLPLCWFPSFRIWLKAFIWKHDLDLSSKTLAGNTTALGPGGREHIRISVSECRCKQWIKVISSYFPLCLARSSLPTEAILKVELFRCAVKPLVCSKWTHRTEAHTGARTDRKHQESSS